MFDGSFIKVAVIVRQGKFFLMSALRAFKILNGMELISPFYLSLIFCAMYCCSKQNLFKVILFITNSRKTFGMSVVQCNCLHYRGNVTRLNSRRCHPGHLPKNSFFPEKGWLTF